MKKRTSWFSGSFFISKPHLFHSLTCQKHSALPVLKTWKTESEVFKHFDTPKIIVSTRVCHLLTGPCGITEKEKNSQQVFMLIMDLGHRL
jgi:hypothetical protein